MNSTCSALLPLERVIAGVLYYSTGTLIAKVAHKYTLEVIGIKKNLIICSVTDEEADDADDDADDCSPILSIKKHRNTWSHIHYWWAR